MNPIGYILVHGIGNLGNLGGIIGGIKSGFFHPIWQFKFIVHNRGGWGRRFRFEGWLFDLGPEILKFFKLRLRFFVVGIQLEDSLESSDLFSLIV